MKTERIETVVIGGGQAGLTMSHSLSLCALPHIVLERQRVAERWRSERWDSLHFQFPNWAMRLPDWAYQGDAPDAFATRDEVVAFIEAYAKRIGAPLRTGIDVRALRRAPDWDGFVLDTGHSVIEAANVVIATGPYQQAVIPAATQGIGAVFQIPASGYRRPGQLPAGGMLVVGAGASGCQIAEELLRDGRPVYLSVGPHRRTPRRHPAGRRLFSGPAVAAQDEVLILVWRRRRRHLSGRTDLGLRPALGLIRFRSGQGQVFKHRCRCPHVPNISSTGYLRPLVCRVGLSTRFAEELAHQSVGFIVELFIVAYRLRTDCRIAD